MTNSTRAIFIISFFLLNCFSSFAQQEDFGMRYSVALSTDLLKDIEGSLEIEQRHKNNSTILDRTLAQASLKYEFINNLKVGAGYRYAYIYHNFKNNEVKHRLYLDLNYGFKFARFKPSYRCRWQYGGDDILWHSDVDHLFRQRIKVDYEPFGKPFSPFVMLESFSELSPEHQGLFQAYRYSAGLSYDINKSIAASCYYMREIETNIPDGQVTNAISFELEIKL